MYTNHDEAMAFLTKEFVKKGIIEASAVDAEIKNIVGSIPSATRDTYGDDDAVAAANFYPTYSGNQTSSVPSAITTQASGSIAIKKEKATFVTPTIDDAAAEAMRNLFEQNQEQRIRNTPLTKITRILVENPKPSSYLTGKTVIPDCPGEKLAEYEGKLVQDEENKKAFASIKEAVGKKAMPVYLNDANAKVSGVEVETPALGQGKTEAEKLTLTTGHLVGFLVTRVLGRIPSEPTVGVELRTILPVTKGRKTDATAAVGRPQVKWVRRSEALKDDKMVETLNEIVKVGQKVDTKEGRLRIAASFKIVSDKKNADGTNKIQTIRLSGKSAEIPKFKRKEAYRAVFGDLSDSQNLSAWMNDTEKAEAVEASQRVITTLLAGQLAGSAASYGPEIVKLSEQIKQAAKSGAANTAGNFEG